MQNNLTAKQTQQRARSRLLTLIAFIVLIVLIALPWGIGVLFRPLQPAALGITATAYQTIAIDLKTKQAENEMKTPSVLTTDVSSFNLPEPGMPSLVDVVLRRAAPTNPPTFTPTGLATSAAPSVTSIIAASVTGTLPTPTATIKLPVIKSATPPPPQAKHIDLTDADASLQVQKANPDIQGLQVFFTPAGVKITGSVQVAAPLGQTVSAGLEIIGQFVLTGGKLQLKVESVKVNGGDAPDRIAQAESFVNSWLSDYLVRRQVQAFKTEQGVLRLDVLEYQASNFPTPMSTATLNGTITATSTLTNVNSGTLTMAVNGNTFTPLAVIAIKNVSVTVVSTSLGMTPLAAVLSATPLALITVAPRIPSATFNGPTPLLPQIISSTPNAQQMIVIPTAIGTAAKLTPMPGGGFTLTDAQATSFAQSGLTFPQNVTINFLPDNEVHMSGQIQVSTPSALPLLPAVTVTQTVVLTGHIAVVNGQIELKIQTLTVDGLDVARTPIGQQIETRINDWLSQMFSAQVIHAVQTGNGSLTVQ